MLLETAAVMGTLSAVGSSYVIYTWLRSPKDERKQMGNKMIVIMSFLDLASSIAFAVGDAASEYVNDDPRLEGACNLQAFFIQCFGLGSVLWNVVIAWSLYQMVIEKQNPDKLRHKLKYWLAAVLAFTGIMGFVLLGEGQYGDATLWCWIPGKKGDETNWLQLWCFYFWVMLSFVINTLLFTRVFLASESTEGMNQEIIDANRAVRTKLLQYLFFFFLIWSTGILNRGVGWARTYGPPFWTSWLQAFFMPSQGLFNALVKANVFDTIYEYVAEYMEKRQLCGCVADDGVDDGTPSLASARSFFNRTASAKAGASMRVPWKETLLEPAALDSKALFVTTFNMGEAPAADIADQISAWVPTGYDVYAIGVQECMELPQLRELLHNHLGGIKAYTMYTNEIGSTEKNLGYHGMIAITVFARTEDVKSGAFAPSGCVDGGIRSMGRTLPGGYKAQNKGVAGLGFYYHNTSLGFVTAHFAADSGGKRRFMQRNKNTHDGLENTVLVSADVGAGLIHQHHHVFVLGDLNYRMTGEPAHILQDLSKVAGVAKTTSGLGSEWREKRWRQVFSVPTTEYNTNRSFRGPDVGGGGEDGAAAAAAATTTTASTTKEEAAAWAQFQHLDELRAAMSGGHVFSGFSEAPLNFPPSFRRKMGEIGKCGDYTDYDTLEGAFTTQLDKNAPPTLQESSAEDGGDDGVDEEEEKEDAAASINTAPSSSKQHELDDESPAPTLRDEPVHKVSIDNTVLALKKRAGAVKAGARPPSYTDRVLVHSLLDRRPFLDITGGTYDLCDDVLASDHRPVALTCALGVDASYSRGKKGAKGSKGSSGYYYVYVGHNELELKSPRAAKRHMAEDLAHLIQSSEAGVDLEEEEDEEEGGLGEGDEDEERITVDMRNTAASIGGSLAAPPTLGDLEQAEPTEIELVFPIPAEDPFVEHRGVAAVAGMIGAKTQKKKKKNKTMLKSASGREFSEKTLRNTAKVSWSEFQEKGIYLHSEVTPELGMHALLRIHGKNDAVLGQGMVCLVDVVRKQARFERTPPDERISSLPGKGLKFDLSVGGQYRGEITVDVKCEELMRNATTNQAQPASAPDGDVEEGAAVARRDDRAASADHV